MGALSALPQLLVLRSAWGLSGLRAAPGRSLASVRAAGFDEPVWQTRIRRATAASLAEEVGEWYRSGAAPKRIVEAALAAHAAQDLALKALWAAVLESEDLLRHVLGALDVHRLAVPLTCRFVTRGHEMCLVTLPSPIEVKSEYVSESRAMEGKFGGCGAAAPRNFF